MNYGKEINYDLIDELYYEWRNERNPFAQRNKRDEIKRKISPYEFLVYSSRNSYMPFKIFRNIFGLSDLFDTLEKMQMQGKDISNLTNQLLLIETPEDIRDLNNFAKRETTSEISNLYCVCTGNNIFRYGDVKSIGKKFSNIHVNNLSLKQIENMIKSQNDYKGIPINITIDNIGQLPLDKLAYIETKFDVEGIQILDRDKVNQAHQGERTPLNLRTYKQVRTIANDIISKLYIDKNSNSDKMHNDFQLAIQIIDEIAHRIDYDYDAENKPRSSDEVINASGMVGLLTGKSLCKGYSEILRNILSCVDVECTVIDGTDMNNNSHTWNQVKLGDRWFNIDLTYARNAICNGKPSGDLFMSDMAFYGNRKQYTFEKGQEVNGKKVESTVMIGGHSSQVYGSNCRQCRAYVTPYLTSILIEKSRNYNENYNGIIQYVGSDVEKARSESKTTSNPQR